MPKRHLAAWTTGTEASATGEAPTTATGAARTTATGTVRSTTGTASPATATAPATRLLDETGWPVRLGVSIGLAGFLAFMGALSFPLPWTPVPFSMMPFALLVVGAYQRPGYAVLSVAIYLLAGAAGAPIYADRASGWQHLVGPTAGYLWGFVVASSLVAWYMRAPRPLLSPRWLWGIGSLVGAAVLGGIAAVAWMWQSGQGLTHLDGEVAQSWGVARSALWALLFLTAASTGLTLWLLARRRGEGHQAANLFFVMLASIVALHVCGVTVLWLATPLSLMAAIILGSIVFLPFDMVKAGLAVGLAMPFLPRSGPTQKEGGVHAAAEGGGP